MRQLQQFEIPQAIEPAIADLERARECCAQRLWAEAYRAFVRADRTSRLAAQDLELLATSAYLIGLDAEYLQALERAHLAHLDARAVQQAVRCAYWIGLQFVFRGESGQANGWVSRAWRLLEAEAGSCVEAGMC